MALADVRQQALDLLTRGTTRPRSAGEALRAGESAVSPPARPFSPFISEHLQRAVNLADRFMAIADATPGEDGLRAALEEAERAMADDPGAASHALMMFITHHPEGSQLPIPALEERQPEILDLSARAVADMARTDIDPEAALAWFRTDPLANQHHEHWHVVYPHEGVPDGHSHAAVQDRQGEIFLYMHQQMLARYDAERLAGGLEKIIPFSDYRATIPEGYEPHLTGYIGRPPNSHMRDVHLDPVHHPEQLYTVAQHEGFRDAIGMAIRDKHYTDQKPVEINSLGATVESTIASDSRPTYGNLHNLGHVLLALIGSPDDIGHGVMWSTGTAIMDPVFWQWHRHVDDFAFRWQEAQPSSDFGDSPAVLMRSTTAGASEDVAVCTAASVDGSGAAGFDWAAWGERTFGGDAWPKPASDIEPATGELRTRIATRTAAGRDLPYLDHDDFVYVVRVENQRDAPADVTIRIFLGPEASVEDRRAWIEMDKFHQQLRPRSRTVVVRPNRLSSVIQKPAHRPPQPRRTPGSDAAANYCNCGWPFNLLLPKGAPEGMPFRLMVMLSDWTIDQTGSDTACGSMSFCGARDARYPDSRPMGYPFDRRLPGGVIATLAALSNVGLHAISIRHESTSLSTVREMQNAAAS
jgi:tyrosinase